MESSLIDARRQSGWRRSVILDTRATPFDVIADYHAAYSDLSVSEKDCLRQLMASSIRQNAKAELLAPGVPLDRPQFILSGWLMKVLTIGERRRQVIDFCLPGELIGFSSHPGAKSLASHLAITDVVLSTSDSRLFEVAAPALRKVCAAAERQKERRYFMRITGLAQKAHERLAGLIVDWRERLDRVGMVKDNSFDMPLTQEIIGDALGLSAVHTNRTVQRLRKERLIDLSRGQMRILDLERLSHLANASM